MDQPIYSIQKISNSSTTKTIKIVLQYCELSSLEPLSLQSCISTTYNEEIWFVLRLGKYRNDRKNFEVVQLFNKETTCWVALDSIPNLSSDSIHNNQYYIQPPSFIDYPYKNTHNPTEKVIKKTPSRTKPPKSPKHSPTSSTKSTTKPILQECRKDVDISTIHLAFYIGYRLCDAKESNEVKEWIKELVPNAIYIPFPSNGYSPEGFERCRVLLITRIDQMYVKHYTLVVVYALNLGILLKRTIDIWDSKGVGNWGESMRIHINALRKWETKLRPILTSEMIKYLEDLYHWDLFPVNTFDLSQEFKKVKRIFKWGDAEKNKWVVSLCLAVR
ncbi:Uncharacterized protein QTN25_007416 [Entamoeba marina]